MPDVVAEVLFEAGSWL